VAGFCEHGNEQLGSMKCEEYNDETVSLSRTFLHGVNLSSRFRGKK
jgi:hypothetical protein